MQPTETKKYGALGSEENLNKLLSAVGAKQLPTTKPPTSATDVSGNFPAFQIPTSPATFTPIDSAIATTQGEKEYVSRVQKEQEAAYQRAQKQTESDRGILSEILMRRPDRKAIAAEAESELDTSRAEMLNQINSVIKEVETLNESYNKEKETMDLSIARMEENLGGQSQSGLDYNVTKAQRNFSIKLNALAAGINAKTATVEALRGNYKLANDYIQQAVDAETAQYKDDVDALMLYRDFNNDAFERIDSIYKDAYEAEITIAQNRLNDEREKSLAKFKAGLDADTGTGPGSSFSDVMQGVIDAGGTPEQAARAAAQESELMGIQVDQKQLSKWTEEARMLSKTPSPTEDTPTSKIEQDIQSIKNNPVYEKYPNKKAILEKELSRRGYSNSEVIGSSAGSTMDKISSSAGAFFSNLFGY